MNSNAETIQEENSSPSHQSEFQEEKRRLVKSLTDSCVKFQESTIEHQANVDKLIKDTENQLDSMYEDWKKTFQTLTEEVSVSDFKRLTP